MYRKEIQSLSSFSSHPLSSSLDGLTYKQSTKNLEGNFILNFCDALSSIRDVKTKNYTNFYLTDNYRLSNVFDVRHDVLENTKMTTKLKMGEEYLALEDLPTENYIQSNQYSNVFDYKKVKFVDETSASNFELEFFDKNICHVYGFFENQRFILCSDVSNNLFFIQDYLKPTSSSTTLPYQFKYMYGEDNDFLYLFQTNINGSFNVTKSNDDIALIPVTDNFAILASKIKISRKKIYRPDFNINSNYVRYTNGNDIDTLKSRDLTNNLLLHKKIDNASVCDFLILKNQMSETNKAIQGNNLLSGDSSLLEFVENRDYTSILEEIPSEHSDHLSLNYVFHNKDYEISSGITYFVSPSSMEPFQKLNINDTKFIECGAFSFPTPEYADKIYQENENEISPNGQYLLCTWLSGHPTSPEKVWVDRYYYPDLIDKREALSTKPLYGTTYDNYIENLLLNTSSLSSSVSTKKIFDKKSDLVFEPNKKYRYERISKQNFEDLSIDNNQCDQLNVVNYVDYTEINRKGQFTLSFYFDDSNDWTLNSQYNNIATYLQITKIDDTIEFIYNLYNPSNGKYLTSNTTSKIKKFKKNFVNVSIDSITGDYNIFLNDKVIFSDTLPPLQFYRKPILLGNFKFNNESLENNNTISNVKISATYTSPETAFITPILDGNVEIQNITVTLPCGMRNNEDIINLIHSFCASESFKSNNINLILKNLNINNNEIIENLKRDVISKITPHLPVNTKINDVTVSNWIN